MLQVATVIEATETLSKTLSEYATAENDRVEKWKAADVAGQAASTQRERVKTAAANLQTMLATITATPPVVDNAAAVEQQLGG